ncbi:MAG: LON peptidase substrate-binding domain-containing protein, partial [Bacteroidota bacterium]
MAFFNFDTESFFDDDFPIITSVDEQEDLQDEIPEEIGILTLKNTVLFPGVVIPITVGRDKSIHLVKEMYAKERKLIGVVAQNNIEIETPTINDLYNCGTIARILKLIKMPDGSVTIVIQGRSKFRIEAFTGE